MIDFDRIETAVIVPARNEAQRIGSCMAALAPQLGATAIIVVVANNCSDGTAEAARRALPDGGLLVLEADLPAEQGVGAARRLGCAKARRRAPRLRWLLTTDADCVVAEDWLRTNLRHLEEVDAVCGSVVPLPSESRVLRRMPLEAGCREAEYRKLVLEFYALHLPEPHNPPGHHGDAPGASLAFSRSAYFEVGGFADLRTGEDRDLVRRMRRAGLRVRHASDVRVAASCRLIGRAPGGMAQALRHRLSEIDHRVDDALPPAAWLLDQTVRGALPPWPPEVPEMLRLRAAQLPEQISRLRQAIRFGRHGPARVD